MIQNFIYRNPTRERIQSQLIQFENTLVPRSTVLDAGAGTSPYSEIFENHTYQTADFMKVDRPYSYQNYVCELHAIPVGNEIFDAIICTQVFEHLKFPDQTMQEFSRILKKNGLVMITAPFFYPLHEEPYDFFRYTPYSLTHLAERHGFKIVNVKKLDGKYAVLSAIFASEAAKSNQKIVKIFYLLLKGIFNFLESKTFPKQDARLYKTNCLVFRKI